MVRMHLYLPSYSTEMLISEERFESVSLGLIEAICAKSGGLTATIGYGYWNDPDTGALIRQDVTVFDVAIPGDGRLAQYVKNLFSDWLFATSQTAGICIVDGVSYRWSRELYRSSGYAAAWESTEVLH